jgi:hypothetical protein
MFFLFSVAFCKYLKTRYSIRSRGDELSSQFQLHDECTFLISSSSCGIQVSAVVLNEMFSFFFSSKSLQ